MRVRDAAGARVRIGSTIRKCESEQIATVVAFIPKFKVEVHSDNPPRWWESHHHQLFTSMSDWPFGSRVLTDWIVEREA